MTTVGMIGLGQMGAAMTETLLRQGFAVTGTDLDPARRAVAEGLGATVGASIAAVCAATDVVLLSLPEARHVEAVVAGPDGIMAHARPGTLVLDATTSEPAVSRKLAAAMAAAGHAFLDAPVSGGPHGARAGTLAIMVGGEAAAFERARPVLEALSAKLTHIGPAGSGNVVKLVNNLMLSAHLLVAAEAVRLAEAAGVPAAQLLEVVNASSGRSLVSEDLLPRCYAAGQFRIGFAAALMRKDVRLALALADEAGVPLAVNGLVGRLWAESAAAVPDTADFTRVAERIIKAEA